MNNDNIRIRLETERDYREVENLTREAFWNVYAPGCSEHYFVHKLRSHQAFVPELAYVLEKDGRIIGNAMYSKALLQTPEGERKTILSLGLLSIAPGFQRQGGSRLLLEYTFEKAKELGYSVVVNFGNPGNYVSRGYRSCKHLKVSLRGEYPTALLVKELVPDALQGKVWHYIPSDIDACCEDAAAVAAFDATFPPKTKERRPSQEEFYIYSHSNVVR